MDTGDSWEGRASLSSFAPLRIRAPKAHISEEELEAQLDFIMCDSAAASAVGRGAVVLDNEWVRAQGIGGVATAQQFRERVRADMTRLRQHQLDEARPQIVAHVLAERLAVDIPEDVVDAAVDEARCSFEAALSSSGMTVEGYLVEQGLSPAQLVERQRADVVEQMRRGIALDLVAEHLGFDEPKREQRRLHALQWAVSTVVWE